MEHSCALAKNTFSRKKIYIGASVSVGIGFVAIFVAQWLTTPAGERWVATGGADRVDVEGGTLFLDRRIAPRVRDHYARRIEEWGTAIRVELEVTPEGRPSVYFFYDRAAFEKYSKETSKLVRAFYTSKTHSIYTHGSFDVGGQITNLDEEGTLVHELTHALVQSSLGSIPVWLDEGLAHYIENGALHQGRWYSGVPAGGHANAVFDAIADDRLPLLADLFQAGPREFAEMGRLSRGQSEFVVMLLYERGHLKKFLKSVSALQDRNDSDEILRLLGETCGRAPDDLQAEFVAFVRSKSDIEAYGNAIRLAAAGRHAEAIRFYRKAVELDPSRGRYWDRLGLSLYLASEEESSEESFRAYATAAAADPYRSQLTTLTIVGNHLFDGGRYQEARQAYQRVLERTLPTPTILHNLAVT